MLEDLVLISSLRKRYLSRTDAFFKKCQFFIAAGSDPVCQLPCRVCDSTRRFREVLRFYGLRDKENRPERKLLVK